MTKFICGEGCHLTIEGCSQRTNNKLDTFDWLSDIPESREETDFVEVTFKNTRKGYYRNTNGLALKKGDMVAVESSPGHDIGTISLVGQLVLLQMKKNKVDPLRCETKKVYRIARDTDIEKYEEAKGREHDTMLRSRHIAEELGLKMKIGDVEYQGDGNKAIFYYIADERVDFRQLIKILADTFKVKIEMKQIGARQEAGRIGGIGPCGRPLCCSSWMSNFVSVSTSAARYQEISLNPQKLAGQCAKLKCCLIFELDDYIEAQKGIPSREIQLETQDGTYYHFKTDVFAKTMQYSSDPHMAANIVTLSVDRVKEIMQLNRQGVKVDRLEDEEENNAVKERPDYENVVGQDSLTRFDSKKKSRRNNNRRDDRNRDDRGPRDNRDRNRNNRFTDRADKPADVQDGTPATAPVAAADNEGATASTDAPTSPNTNNSGDDRNRGSRYADRGPRDNRDRRDDRGPRDNRDRRSDGGNRSRDNRDDRSHDNRDRRDDRDPRDNRDRRDDRNRGSRYADRGPRDNRDRRDDRGPRDNRPRDNRGDSRARGPRREGEVNAPVAGNAPQPTPPVTPAQSSSAPQPNNDNKQNNSNNETQA